MQVPPVPGPDCGGGQEAGDWPQEGGQGGEVARYRLLSLLMELALHHLLNNFLYLLFRIHLLRLLPLLRLLLLYLPPLHRVLYHYNGHGVPKPTANGEIWVFNRSYTQYIPLSIYDLQV